MCESGDVVPMWLPTEHAPGWKLRPVDRCIAPLVAALRAAGFETVNSCCGHGKRDTEVLLADGREVIVRQHLTTWVMADTNTAAPEEDQEEPTHLHHDVEPGSTCAFCAAEAWFLGQGEPTP